jgi:hypothetical protein
MSDKPSVVIKIHEASERITTESLEVGFGVKIQRIRVVRQEQGKETETVTEKVEGPPIKGENPGSFCVVEPELLEKLRITGWFIEDNLISKSPFTRCTSGIPYRVVRLKSYDHTLYDLDGLPLPVGIFFDYISGSVNNTTFRLEPLLTALEARNDVRIIPDRYGNKVQSVLGYNGGSLVTRFVAFIWAPGVELYREYRQQVVTNKSIWDAKRRIALTMMGLGQYRIND